MDKNLVLAIALSILVYMVRFGPGRKYFEQAQPAQSASSSSEAGRRTKAPSLDQPAPAPNRPSAREHKDTANYFNRRNFYKGAILFSIFFWGFRKQKDRRRAKELSRKAQEMGLAYTGEIALSLILPKSIQDFWLFDQGFRGISEPPFQGLRNSFWDLRERLFEFLHKFGVPGTGPRKARDLLRNLLRDRLGAITVYLFDYHHVVHRKTFTRQTVAVFQGGAGLPSFELKPKSFIDKIQFSSKSSGFVFDSHPDFSKLYSLKGRDEGAIRNLFKPEVLDFFKDVEDWYVEGDGKWMLVYGLGVAVPADGLPDFLRATKAIRSLFPE